VSSVELPEGWNSAQTKAAIPTAAWMEAPVSSPVLGLSSNQISGVETTPAAASAMTVIFHPCDMRPSPSRRRRAGGSLLRRVVAVSSEIKNALSRTVVPVHPDRKALPGTPGKLRLDSDIKRCLDAVPR
jgi:hypothetical protein